MKNKMKTLDITSIKNTKENIPDLKVVGDGDLFKVILKVSSKKEGWMKSMKAMEVPSGCVIQTTTQQKNTDGSYAIAEALVFVPGICIEANFDENLNPDNKLIGVPK